MTTRTPATLPITGQPTVNSWIRLGAIASLLAIVAVLALQALALAIWPEVAQFKPLESYARSALFTLVPAVGATVIFARLAGRRAQADATFVRLSIVVLLLSVIPDYILPVPNKTALASTVAAVLHGAAALVIVTVLVAGYRREVIPTGGTRLA